jgi:predicted MFS family arabinose efflux permease
VDRHWLVYLPVALGSFVIAVPGIIWAESRGYMRRVFIAAVALMTCVMLGFAFGYTRPVTLIAAMFFFFVSFNVMEALIPSLVSRTAPAARKGLALGVYNTAQSLGLFAGGALGGVIAKTWSSQGVFLTGAALSLAWLAVAWFIRPPRANAVRPV